MLSDPSRGTVMVLEVMPTDSRTVPGSETLFKSNRELFYCKEQNGGEIFMLEDVSEERLRGSSV